jgi:hypothetical protein
MCFCQFIHKHRNHPDPIQIDMFMKINVCTVRESNPRLLRNIRVFSLLHQIYHRILEKICHSFCRVTVHIPRTQVSFHPTQLRLKIDIAVIFIFSSSAHHDLYRNQVPRYQGRRRGKEPGWLAASCIDRSLGRSMFVLRFEAGMETGLRELSP